MTDENTYLIYQAHNRALVDVMGVDMAVIIQNDIAMLVLPSKYKSAVPNLLSKKRNCGSCTGSQANMFRMATDMEIKQWKGELVVNSG